MKKKNWIPEAHKQFENSIALLGSDKDLEIILFEISIHISAKWKTKLGESFSAIYRR